MPNLVAADFSFDPLDIEMIQNSLRSAARPSISHVEWTTIRFASSQMTTR